MGSADFSQFVVTTANETACETSTLKVHALSSMYLPHLLVLPATFGLQRLLAALSVFPSLICGFCPSGQRFAYSFLQIPPHDGHPCCSAMCFVVAYAYSGLSPVRARPWRANQKRNPATQDSFLNTKRIPTLKVRIFASIFYHIYSPTFTRKIRFYSAS